MTNAENSFEIHNSTDQIVDNLAVRIPLASLVGCLPEELYALGYPKTTDVETLRARKEALDEEFDETEMPDESSDN